MPNLFSAQPLERKIEVNGRSYVIAHAWYESEGDEDDAKDEHEAAFQKRHCRLWKRDREDCGKIMEKYAPSRDEKLVHGHSPTIGKKRELRRGYSPGKIWDTGSSVNIDCGLVHGITKRSAAAEKYGNLAAYKLETGEAEYLWDIADDYALNDDEYYEDAQEREERECREEQRKRREAFERYMPYLLSFYKQVFDKEGVPEKDDCKDKCNFNFLGDSVYPIQTGRKRSEEHDFDLENEPMLAVTGGYGKKTLYVHYDGEWQGVDLSDGFTYKIFGHGDSYYLLGANCYTEEFAEVSVHAFCNHGASQVLYYRTSTPHFYYDDADDILKGDAKMGKDNGRRFRHAEGEDRDEPTGLMTCDFYGDDEMFGVKLLKNRGDHFIVRILDSQGNTLSEIRQCY